MTLGELLGPSSEVVLHDLRRPKHSIVAVSKYRLTGRNVGDTLDALGLHLFQQSNFEDMANYETKTGTGKVLHSCSVFVKDDKGKPIGALCVNQDRSALIKMRDWLDQILQAPTLQEGERAENNVEDVLSQLIQDAIRSTGKTLEHLTREDKVAVISHLNARGAFLIRYSMEKVASLLSISRFSIYNYLENLRPDSTTPKR
jgi:predicted transcriptional regulator YheO